MQFALQLQFEMWRLLFIVFLGILLCSLDCQAACYTCGATSNVACISDSQFQFCASNQTIGPINSCPAGSYCTSQTTICDKNPALKACGTCGKCNEQGTFACTGPRSFALCLGSSRPSNITSSCTGDLVCNMDLPKICGSAAVTSATCAEQTATTEPITTASTTTESTPLSLDAFCRAAFKGIPIHAIPNDRDCTR